MLIVRGRIEKLRRRERAVGNPRHPLNCLFHCKSELRERLHPMDMAGLGFVASAVPDHIENVRNRAAPSLLRNPMSVAGQGTT